MLALKRISLALLVLFAAGTALAQVRTVGQIVGVVEDATGAYVLGAKVTVVDESTGLTRTTTTESDGRFVFVDLVNGTYRVTAVMQGFKTAVYPGIKVDLGRTTNLTVKLEVGALQSTVVVEAGAEVLQTTATAIETTVTGRELRSLPLNNRDVLDFVLLMPGAQQGGTARQSTFHGLPKGAINITMDGLNVQDNLLKSSSGGGMFTIIRPKLDNVEEISVTSATAGADAAGEGAVQIRFVTRRGSNDWHGSAFWNHRNDGLNANTWFNNAAVPQVRRPRELLNVYGGNVGGPAIKDKVFFFFAFEDFWLREVRPRTNTLLTDEAASGIFRYRGTDGVVRTGNLLAIASAVTFDCDLATPGVQPCPSTIDPVVTPMLATIRTTRGNGALSSFDLFRDRLTWDAGAAQRRWFPTLRVDYNISNKLRWHGVGNFNKFSSSPDTLNSQDPPFPGLTGPAGGQFSNRWSLTTALNWEIRPSLTYEFRLGRQRAPVKFAPELTAATLGTLYPNGVRLNWPLGVQNLQSNPGGGCCRTNFSFRDTPALSWGNNLGWVKGKHTFNFGTALSVYTHWDASAEPNTVGDFGVPVVNFGLVGTDPAAGAFSSATLPAISSADVSNARALYALLVGRISSISGSRNVDEVVKTYKDRFPLTQRNRQNEFGFYFTDSWRLYPTLTMNYGLRWEYQGPPFNSNDIFTSPTFEHLWGKSGVGNLFKPGTLTGVGTPQIALRTKDLYERSFRNFAPHLGFAWTPKIENSVWKAIFGGPGKSVLRGGYSIAYTREGLNHFLATAGNNPGLTQNIFLSPGDPGFAPGSLLLRNPLPALLTFPTSFSFPVSQSLFTFQGINLNTIDPKLKVPYVQSWSFGIQRELSPSTVLEVRYVGNHGTRLWRRFSINEVNIFENGFLADFKRAQSNLAIFTAANPNCGKPGQPLCNFGNVGLPGQQNLPIFTAAFGPLGTQPALGLSSGFGSATFITDLVQGEAGRLANRLAGSSTTLCRMVGNALQACADRNFTVPGVFPANFFQVNPDLAGAAANLLTNASSSSYHGLQVEVRRRMSKGLMLEANYTWSKSLTNLFADSSFSGAGFTTLRNRALDKGPSPWDLRHSTRIRWIYELPFGPGRKWSSSNSVVNKVIEGWEFLGVVALQSGRVFKLTSGRQTVDTADSGVILKGITTSQLQDMVRIVKPAGTPGRTTGFVFFIDPSLIGADGRSNRAFLDVPATPGEFGQFVYLRGPRFVKPDLTIAKKTKIGERVIWEFRAEFYNAFNYQNFMVGAVGGAGITQSIDSTSFGQTNIFFNDLGNQDPGPRMVQFFFRISF